MMYISSMEISKFENSYELWRSHDYAKRAANGIEQSTKIDDIEEMLRRIHRLDIMADVLNYAKDLALKGAKENLANIEKEIEKL